MERFSVEYPAEDAKETIADFVNATPNWYEEIPEEKREHLCILCGISPDKMLELAQAIAFLDIKNKTP